MWMALFTIGLLVFGVAIVGTLVTAIMRKPVWKKWLATIGLSFATMIVAAVQAPSVDTPVPNPPSAAVSQSQSQGFVAAPIPVPIPTETAIQPGQLEVAAVPETKTPESNSAVSDAPAATTMSSPAAPGNNTPQSTSVVSQAPAAATTGGAGKTVQPPATPKTVSPAPAPVTSNQSMTVYIGATGTKYHLQSCRTLKNTKTPISINDAKAQGRTACKICNPPQ